MPKYKLEEKINYIIRLIDLDIERKMWTNQEINERFSRRSAKEIVEEGDTCYMNPCLDYTLVLLEMLKKFNLNPFYLIIESLKDDINEFVIPHFAAEFDHGGIYFVDFSTMNRVIFGKGNYRNTKNGIRTIRIDRISGDKIEYDQNIARILGLERFEEIERLLPGYSVSKHLARLIKSNTKENYEVYLKKLGDDWKLKIIAE